MRDDFKHNILYTACVTDECNIKSLQHSALLNYFY